MTAPKSAKPAAADTANGPHSIERGDAPLVSEANLSDGAQQVRRGRGRPPGLTPIVLKAIALQLALEKHFELSSPSAAKAAAILLNPVASFVFTRRSENVADFECEPAGLADRTKYLRDCKPFYVPKFSSDERLWVDRSADHIRMLFLSIVGGAVFNVASELACLAELGWAAELASFFKRVTAAKMAAALPSAAEGPAVLKLEEEFYSLRTAHQIAIQPDRATGIEPRASELGLLYGFAAIGDYIDMTEQQVRRLISHKQLPCFKIPGRRGYVARRADLNVWLANVGTRALS